ncbi:kinase-like domain-containing protein [Mycena sp. CBHHK59/15]|nr:kinase-like domain-containing protein [Mycena sp. CBHHK59/15]
MESMPTELKALVAKVSDKGDQLAWMRTCASMRDMVLNLLYVDIDVTGVGKVLCLFKTLERVEELQRKVRHLCISVAVPISIGMLEDTLNSAVPKLHSLERLGPWGFLTQLRALNWKGLVTYCLVDFLCVHTELTELRLGSAPQLSVAPQDTALFLVDQPVIEELELLRGTIPASFTNWSASRVPHFMDQLEELVCWDFDLMWNTSMLVITVTNWMSNLTKRNTEMEMEIHHGLTHEHVLRFMGARRVPLTRAPQRIAPGFYLLLDWATSGELFDKIEPGVGLAEDVVLVYFNQLRAGMEYDSEKLKICDFGLLAVFENADTGEVCHLSWKCSTYLYVVPKMWLHNTYKATGIDVWAMGVILFCMLSGEMLWAVAKRTDRDFRGHVDGRSPTVAPWNSFSEDATGGFSPSNRWTLVG